MLFCPQCKKNPKPDGMRKLCMTCQASEVKSDTRSVEHTLAHAMKHASTPHLRAVIRQWYKKDFSYYCRRCGTIILHTPQWWHEVTCEKCKRDTSMEFYVEEDCMV